MEIQTIYRCAVGIDVHLMSFSVCVIIQSGENTEPEVHLREFGGFKRDKQAMAKWIAGFSPDIVVMESTGIYWKSPYVWLERAGIRALVVNAQHVKKVPGRKTDTSDAQWLAMLARSGLLRGSFIPPRELRNLRQITRYHKKLTGQLIAEKNRLVKTLSDGGIRISAVVSDPHGASATAMIDCLLNGGTPEQALKYANRRLKASREELLMALESDLSEEHIFTAKMQRRHIEYLYDQLAELEHELLARLAPYQPAIDLLKTIPGMDTLSVAQLIVEIGTDMSAFGSPEKLSKWAGICPGNHESAGKRYSGKTTKGNRFVRSLLCQIAWAAVRTTSQFKGKYQGLVIRRGAKRAIVAVAHKILRTVFVLLQRNVPYQDSTVNYEELMVKRNAPRWIKALKQYQLLPQN
ncbi:MAG: IS110 family transposase [Gammaproteobacteria bacterium]|nr:IS110 family transposase [Gammaproteobacteria bacterium]